MSRRAVQIMICILSFPVAALVQVESPGTADEQKVKMQEVQILTDDLKAGGTNAVLHPEQCSQRNRPGWCSGETPDAWINAAFAALPNGRGTVDIRGFNGRIAWHSTVSCGAGQTLLSDWSVEVRPASPSMTMLAQNAGCAVDGLWLDVSNQPSWSGRAISFTGNYQAYNAAGNDVYKAHTTLRRVNLTALGIVTGDALYLGAGNSAKQSIASVVVTDLSVTGFGNCIHLHASGTGWINGNIFSGISCIYSAVGLNLDNRGSDTIEGNVFTGFSFQDGPGTTAGVAALATGIVRYNEMFGAIIWDTTSVPPISLAASHVYNNVFMGRFDGTSNDPSHMNNFLDPLHGVWAAPSMKTQSIQYGSAPGYPVTLAPAVGAPYDVLVPNQAGTANVLALDNAGNLSLGGSVAPGGGTRVVYRCRAAGALPAGTLTINSSECGASVDTGLRTK